MIFVWRGGGKLDRFCNRVVDKAVDVDEPRLPANALSFFTASILPLTPVAASREKAGSAGG